MKDRERKHTYPTPSQEVAELAEAIMRLCKADRWYYEERNYGHDARVTFFDFGEGGQLVTYFYVDAWPGKAFMTRDLRHTLEYYAKHPVE